jgi:hypothetical protein
MLHQMQFPLIGTVTIGTDGPTPDVAVASCRPGDDVTLKPCTLGGMHRRIYPQTHHRSALHVSHGLTLRPRTDTGHPRAATTHTGLDRTQRACGQQRAGARLGAVVLHRLRA